MLGYMMVILNYKKGTEYYKKVMLDYKKVMLDYKKVIEVYMLKVLDYHHHIHTS